MDFGPCDADEIEWHFDLKYQIIIHSQHCGYKINEYINIATLSK
jgi:hypothetical protein